MKKVLFSLALILCSTSVLAKGSPPVRFDIIELGNSSYACEDGSSIDISRNTTTQVGVYAVEYWSEVRWVGHPILAQLSMAAGTNSGVIINTEQRRSIGSIDLLFDGEFMNLTAGLIRTSCKRVN